MAKTLFEKEYVSPREAFSTQREHSTNPNLTLNK